MQSDTIKEVLKLTVATWRASRDFFLSIEVWLMVLMSVLTVAGVWLAFAIEPASLLCFGLVAVYLSARVVLHAKGILRWPFI